jgi:hypothetical protein
VTWSFLLWRGPFFLLFLFDAIGVGSSIVFFFMACANFCSRSSKSMLLTPIRLERYCSCFRHNVLLGYEHTNAILLVVCLLSIPLIFCGSLSRSLRFSSRPWILPCFLNPTPGVLSFSQTCETLAIWFMPNTALKFDLDEWWPPRLLVMLLVMLHLLFVLTYGGVSVSKTLVG